MVSVHQILKSLKFLYTQSTDYARLRRFFGIVGNCCSLIPNVDNLLYPHSELTKLCPNKSNSLSWMSEASKAFQEIKDAITDAAALPLSHPDVIHLQLVTDISQFTIGVALH
ncbi:UNVERIFIED_CONTAM: hypothetical protein RMT77_011573 [Armadillidium vulgare]